MSFDHACFTLHVHRRAESPAITDLFDAADIEAAGISNLTSPPPPGAEIVPLYTHHRALASAVYDVLLTDPRFGDAQLASCTAPSSAERIKTISLHHPDAAVVFAKQGGTMAAFNQGEWRVEWEGSLVLRWKREGSGLGKASYSAAILRSPDPPISIGAYHPPTKRAPALLQIYDHNFQRLEVADPRGLEIVIVQTALTLVDVDFDDDHRSPDSNPFLSTLVPAGGLGLPGGGGADGSPGFDYTGASGSGSSSARPALTSPGSSSSNGGEPAAPNEILITPHGTIESYVGAALNLLQPEEAGGHGCSLIELKATPGRPDAAQKAVAVAAGVKAGWYKLTSTARGSAETDLYQYIRTDEDQRAAQSPGVEEDRTPRRRIQLNGPQSSPSPATSPGLDARAAYMPPSTLSVILSKDRLPELEPKARHPAGGGGLVGAEPPHAFALDDGPRRPPKTMSVRRNGRWTPQPVPSLPGSHAGQHAGPRPGENVVAPPPGSPDAGSGSGSGGGKQHHGRRLLNKLGLVKDSGS
ncbi:hypothetical protein V8E36_005352 [Tilletia maclaganii]